MSLRPASARALAVARRALPWLAAAAAVLLRPHALELADPASCPGLFEFMSIGSVLLDPYLTAGLLLGILATIALFCATAAILRLAMRATGSLAVATAAACAVALGPLFPATLATPSVAGAFAACVAIALMAERQYADARQGLMLTLHTSIVLLAAALIVPPWTMIIATVAAISAWITLRHAGVLERTVSAVALASAIVIAVVALLNISRPDALTGSSSWRSVAACVVPASAFSLGRPLEVMRAAGWALGPLVIALAGLGAFDVARRWSRRDAMPIAAISGLVAAAAMMSAVAAPIACTPVVVMGWWFAARGLHATITAMGRSRVARVGAAILLVLLPVLQAARRGAEERDDQVRPNGHEHLSLQRMRGLLNLTDANAAIAQEDASVDLLLRAAIVGGRRDSKPFIVVPRQADAIERARASRPTYALPRGQLDLGNRGFVLQPVAARIRRRNHMWETISGLEMIVGRRPCRLMQREWVDVSDVAAAGRIAVIAQSDASFGPVSLLLAGATSPVLVPESWSRRMIRGFSVSIFTRRIPAETERLLTEGRTLGVPADHPVLAAPVLLELSLERIPRGPLALPVILGASLPVGIARLDPKASSSEQLWVCDASAAHVTPFEVRLEQTNR